MKRAPKKKPTNRVAKSVKKKIAKRKTVTAPESQALRELAEQLGKLISLSGYRSSFSLQTIAKEMGLSKYMSRKTNKKESFYEFLLNLHRHKPRMTKKLVRKILPPAIEKRHTKGDPILEDEALELVQRLQKVGIDLKQEILDLNLPKERPRTVPPPIAVQKILDAYTLHPVMLPDCKDMFVNGHINESVRRALERFEKQVQDIASMPQHHGSDLMARAFDEKGPKIQFNGLSNPQERNKQIGFKFISMGIMHWWRNNLSHGDEEQLPHHDALSKLILISNLFHELDGRLA